MTHLPDITVVCVDCFMHGAAAVAIKKTLQQIKPAKTVFLTNIEIAIDGVETILITPIKSKEEYSRFIIKEVNKYFDTSHVLIIQHDGYVQNGDAWNDEFYKYDYIGAPWIYEHNRNIGNGGFSLRSKKICDILAKDALIQITHPEDQSIGILYRGYLEETYGIKFPSEELADTFAYELKAPTQKVFGFHGRFHEPYKALVIIKRTGAMGDVIQTEPVLEYFHNKGYRVVLETLPQFEILFQRHSFPVLFPYQLDPRVLATAQRYNLDMSYESNPQQLHLKTYFEYCGVEDYELRNPKLSLGFPITEDTKIFKKMAILHIDNRAQPHRNIYGVNWKMVVGYLEMKGYTVIQLGKDRFSDIDGIKMETVNENLLAYVCASADLFVGIDSGISNICSGFNVPSVIAFGSVNPDYIHADNVNKVYIHNHNKQVCSTPYCWSDVIGCEGQDCVVDIKNPPCTRFETEQFINGINKLINE